LKDVELRVIRELIRDCRRSDRELAKPAGVSQPTVSRIRPRLEKEGVLDYTAVPNLAKLGFEILAITFGSRAGLEPNLQLRVQKARDFIDRHPNLIFVSSGNGMNSDRVAISVHKDYSDYARFKQEIAEEWAEIMVAKGSFVISLTSDSTLKNFTFKYLADAIEEKEARETAPVA
jgi:DNA-binding Lrp family transcriptional regulator